MSSLREKKPKEIKEDRGHPGEMRSDKLNALRCDSVNLTRQAVTSEFHPSTIVPTYGAGRAGKSEVGSQEDVKKLFRYTNARFLGLILVILLSGLLLCQQVTGQQARNTQLVVMTYNIGTHSGEKIPLSRIVAVVESA
jgi:hypothetical protein